jgi:hypothetical protein
MVWGEPLLAQVVEKATEVVKSGAGAKETSATIDKVTEKVTEVATKVPAATTSTQPPSATELEVLSKKATEWASRPENLEALCRAYLEHTSPAVKPEKTSEKPKTEPKPAQAQAQKKSSKPKSAEKVGSTSKPKSAEKPKKAQGKKA